jgi:catechol 2,3-dioxygenase-like lactoylglutathione lyase family enzyme
MTSKGIRHIHLLVQDQVRAQAFYREAFDMEEMFRDGPIVFVGTPGGGDSLALRLASGADERDRVGQPGGIEHFGIHLEDRSAKGIDAAVERIEKAGGTLIERGERREGVPYAYVSDPDGYTIEL